MGIPGFTAEFSVYKSTVHYRLAAAGTDGTAFSDFEPQYQLFVHSANSQYATLPAQVGCPRPACPTPFLIGDRMRKYHYNNYL